MFSTRSLDLNEMNRRGAFHLLSYLHEDEQGRHDYGLKLPKLLRPVGQRELEVVAILTMHLKLLHLQSAAAGAAAGAWAWNTSQQSSLSVVQGLGS